MYKNNKGKVILVILLLLSLGAAGGIYYLFQQEQAKNLALQEELDDIKTRLKITETNLEDYKKKSSDLESKLKLTQDNITKLNSELQQEKTTKEKALTQIEQVRTDLEQQKNLRTDLEKKLTQAQEDLKKVQVQLKVLGLEKVELDMKVKALEVESQGVELGKIVVSPEVTPQPPGPSPETPPKPVAEVEKTEKPEKPKKKASPSEKEGKLLVINKDYNFVVINLGSKDGVDVGDMFSVYHANKYIGDIKIEKLHDSMAAAGLVSSNIKDKISEGDKVVQKTK